VLGRQELLVAPPLGDVVQQGMEDGRVAAAQGGDRQLDRELMAVSVQGLDLEALIQHGTLPCIQEVLKPAQVGVAIARGDDRV
jgi:hypothetical protein